VRRAVRSIWIFFRASPRLRAAGDAGAATHHFAELAHLVGEPGGGGAELGLPAADAAALCVASAALPTSATYRAQSGYACRADGAAVLGDRVDLVPGRRARSNTSTAAAPKVSAGAAQAAST
jgi:hypothetical protein